MRFGKYTITNKLFRIVQSRVFGRRENHQIARPVVVLNSVLMVDDFKPTEESANHFFSNQTMLKYISHTIGIRVAWTKLIKVMSFPIRFLANAAIPKWMFFSMFKLAAIFSLTNLNSGFGKLNSFVFRSKEAHSLTALRVIPGAFYRAVAPIFNVIRPALKNRLAGKALLIHSILLCVLFNHTPSYGVEQWTKTLSGSSQAADIDTNVTTSWSAQDRMLSNYRQGAAVIRNSASTLTVLTGEIALPDSSVTTVRYRKNTSNTSVTWSDLDTGVEANSTQYYVYGLADSDATTFTVKISTSSTAPSGATYYRKLGEFYNDSSGNITNVISYRSEYGSDGRDLVKGWINFNGTGTIAINNSYNVSSITDNGTGDYTITWTTAFADAYYSVAGWAHLLSEQLVVHGDTSASDSGITTTSVRIDTTTHTGAAYDASTVSLIAVGDRV